MRKKSRMMYGEKSPLFRVLLSLPAIVFLVSLSRGIWNYRNLPEVVPPLIPVLWPFSLPLPRAFYLLLPLGTGALLVGSRIWSLKKERIHLPIRDEAPSLEEDRRGAGQGSVEWIRLLVSHPGVVSFLLQGIIVAFYSYTQERLLNELTTGLDLSSFLSSFYGWVLTIFLAIYLFSIIIRMYRKDNPSD